jgi:PPOX class probable F420-dependent enzyme
MSARAGDLEFLDHPIAQHLLTSTELAQLAYTWLDGTPRTVPIWFHWDGEAVVFGTPPRAPKLAALRANPAVAVTIDEHVWPYKVLYLRGIASIDTTDDVSPEYSAAAERYFGPEQCRAWVDQVRGQMAAWDQPMSRIRMRPEWANLIDFQTRFPSALGI